MIFHQPRFSRNKEIFLPQLPFGARSREVATIWSDIKSYPLCPNIFPNWIQKQRLETPTKIEKTHGWGFWSAVKAQQRKYQEIRFIHGSTNSWPRKMIIFVLHQFPSYLGILGGCFLSQKKHQILPDSLVFNHVSSSGTTRYLHCFRTQYSGVTLHLHSVTHWSGTIIGAVVLAPAAQEKRCGWPMFTCCYCRSCGVKPST